MTIDTPPAQQAFETPGQLSAMNGIFNPPSPNVATGSFVDIDTGTAANPAIRFRVRIQFQGPNGNRGVQYMMAGFIQNVTSFLAEGSYYSAGIRNRADSGSNPLPWLDTFLPGTVWYNGSTFAPVSDLDAEGTISGQDTPSFIIPLTADMGAGVQADDDVVDGILYRVGFELNVAVQTTDGRRGGNVSTIYTRRAKAIWSLNGDGLVSQVGPAYAYTPDAEAGVTAPGVWSAVTDGSRPRTTGPTANFMMDNYLEFDAILL